MFEFVGMSAWILDGKCCHGPSNCKKRSGAIACAPYVVHPRQDGATRYVPALFSSILLQGVSSAFESEAMAFDNALLISLLVSFLGR